MNTSKARQIFTWTPRVLSLLFAFFLSLLSLDSFSASESLLYNLASYLLHLSPAFILGFVINISWNNPLWGGLSFLIASIILLIMTHSQPASVRLITSGPSITIGTLFFISTYINHRHGHQK